MPGLVRRLADRDDRVNSMNLSPRSELDPDIITESPLQRDQFLSLNTAVSESDLSLPSITETCSEILLSR